MGSGMVLSFSESYAPLQLSLYILLSTKSGVFTETASLLLVGAWSAYILPSPDPALCGIYWVLSNANYKSVEHRVVVNSEKERVSLAFFYNPNGNTVIKPAEQLVTAERPPLYLPTTFNQYRLYVRMHGPRGKSQVESLKSTQ
ncbi:hypothetical protein OROHE_013307 [Orobanche hederae]